MSRFWCLLLIVMFFLAACSEKKTLFTPLDADRTGVNFQNKINETDSFNILDYLYFYNGGGVAIGDVNNDGLQDIYFTSNQGSNKLYLNKGNLKFEDITQKAVVEGKGNWKTGVTMADVNGDGLLDIYVSEVGKYKSLQGHNELFINNGNLSFSEKSKEYGLAIEGFNTQASFFDYDKDGDLDVFIVNHSVHSTDTYVDATVRTKKNEVSGDKLMRCDRTGDKTVYTEVTEQAGIYSSIIGYGLNIMIGDFNNDNWDDIYVSNDFHENDYYYINNQNGTFTEKSKEAFGHQSRFSMGSDVNDINNDGWLDIITLDMLPSDETVLKSSVSDDPLDIYEFKMSKGYHHQYSKNCLQLNIDSGKKFSDIGLFAGVAATDWSWSPLLADFDNDGIKDLFISNGVVKRPNDLDYIKFISSGSISTELQEGKSSDRLAIEKMPAGAVSNYMFKGTRDVKFVDETTAWGFDKASLSNGAAYADLDNDGDLDLVVNNINEPASIYQNNSASQIKNHYLDIQLKGSKDNFFGYGAKVMIKVRESLQLNYVTGSRGFQSASTSTVHFGLGENNQVDSLQIIWPDGAIQKLSAVKANQRLVLEYKNAKQTSESFFPSINTTLFVENGDSAFIPFKHIENDFVDFNLQQLIPHEISTQGPKLAVADVNGDGLDDFFVCGAKGQASKLFVQKMDGRFVSTNENLFSNDAGAEDVNAVFFDADGDNDKDLYVVSGGNERVGKDSLLLDRLYLNNGKGVFIKSATLPPIFENKSVAVAEDVDHDGDLDLFLGGRVVAGNYGLIPNSYLLLNDGKGAFSIADENAVPGLRHVGMVTDAVWSDIDKDGWKDLVIVGEWMPITVYKNEKGHLRNVTQELNLANTTGLWMTICASDIDKDGYEDLLVGNWGLNTKLQASEAFPLQLYIGDIDKNGSVDQLVAVAKQNRYYTFLGKEEIEKAMPSVIRKNYLDYKSMAGQTVENILSNHLPLDKLSANTLSSVLIRNNKGKLLLQNLPASVQWSPQFAFLCDDFNHDNKTDILSGGNFYGVIPYEGRYDAGFGAVLLSNGIFFKPLLPTQSGLLLNGEVRSIKKINTARNPIYLVAKNNDRIQVFSAR